MNILTVFVLIVLAINQCIDARPTPMYCAVCEVVIDEINQSINRTTQQHDYTIQTRFRIDEKKSVSYARSESVLLSVVEDELPSIIAQYGLIEQDNQQSNDQSIDQSAEQTKATKAAKRAKKQKRVHLIKQVDFDSHIQSINQSTSDESNVQPTKQLNRSASTVAEVKRLFDHLVDHHLEGLLLAFHRGEGVELDTIKYDVCIVTARACKKGTDFSVNPLSSQSINQSAEPAQPTLALPSGDESNSRSTEQLAVIEASRDL